MSGRIRLLLEILFVCSIMFLTISYVRHHPPSNEPNTQPLVKDPSDLEPWDSIRYFRDMESLGKVIKQARSMTLCSLIFREKQLARPKNLPPNAVNTPMAWVMVDGTLILLRLPPTHPADLSCQRVRPSNRIKPTPTPTEREQVVSL